MNDQERILFEALSRDRAGDAKTINKAIWRNIKTSLVDKYTDQAHFVYELLQNADDAHATNARFVLERDRLIFTHNGTRRFSVSDVATEESDYEKGLLGDINSITSILSNKDPEKTIGKFGVGFKAVFQYTETPHIYDPNFRFKIEDFIVPILLENDYPMRCQNETLFVFPFNRPQQSAEEAYEDISNKLRNLSFPLLFLPKLQTIEYKFDNAIGLYGKEIIKTYQFDDVTAEKVCLTQNNGDDLYDENLWLFSKTDAKHHKYSVGFFFDEDGHLLPKTVPAFCFFSTKETTGLNFIIHAPFLLTDSREGIRAGVSHNEEMVKGLADLAAEALVYLKEIGKSESIRIIDDRIIDIIPYDGNRFSKPEDKSRISFLPFFDAIKATFQKEELIPSTDGYVRSENAYWAAVPQMAELFSNEQLKKLSGNSAAGWAFSSIGREETQRNNKSLCSYIESLVNNTLYENQIIYWITANFIEQQDFPWLHLFYAWLSESEKRKRIIRKEPVFLNQEKKAVAAFDDAGQLILFLPVEGLTGYNMVHPELLNNPETSKLIEAIGIKQPSLRDQIYNIILPQYEKGGGIDIMLHFKLFFDYYCENCINGKDVDFIDLIKQYKFLRCYRIGDQQHYRAAASSMYFPTPELEDYFESKQKTLFLALNDYKALVGETKEKYLDSFLSELGIKKEISIINTPLFPEGCGRNDLPSPIHKKYTNPKYEEKTIDGCKEIIDVIVETKDTAKSFLLWNCLKEIIQSNCNEKSLSSLLEGNCFYQWHGNKKEPFISSIELYLQEKPWVIDKNGQFVCASSLSQDSLSEEYNTSTDEAKALLDFLGIKPTKENVDEEEEVSYLTDSQKEQIDFAKKWMPLGLDESEWAEFQAYKRQREARLSRAEQNPDTKTTGRNQTNEDAQSTDDLWDENDFYPIDLLIDQGQGKRQLNKKTTEVMREIARRTKETPSATAFEEQETEDETDQDEYMPPAVDYSQRIERAKQKSAKEIDKITYLEDLQNRALSLPKYSFGWFKTLLELESITGESIHSDSKEISISFAKVEREPGTNRILVLKHPNRYIPQFMEDLADISLVLHRGDTTQTVAIEVANVQSYSLRVKLKSGADIDNIDLTSVHAATIDAKSPVFLLEALRKEFAALGYADDFNMRDNLCGNIEFVFGPPGTGKTTYLAKKVLLPLMKNEDNCKVLVLTPTNKAADVLVRRIMEVSEEDRSFEEWLIRFGATGDEEIEQSSVFRDKTFDINALSKHVTITTIARFPYDFFMPPGKRISLNEINWDYIVIDEASMIPIANIVYPLYKKTPRESFIIAGDPFQIEPIASVNLWKNENIYSMVKLDSFDNPKTVPHTYKVTSLTTQYRSIPEIGSIFSRFAYGGILDHYRASESQRPLNLDSEVSIKPLNIIKFPVSKYESIYRPKRLQQSSSYQIYSAIFTYEYICFLSKKIAAANPGSLFKIGVIAPYRAQADLIDKLFASEPLPKEVDVQIGTIHGFQGDECDIIFAVFNTPPTISTSKEMFLNKRNIINVSISRAQDYLFIVMPDDDTDNIENLQLVKAVEYLIKKTTTWTEVLTSELETMMFGCPNYLENNTFSTSHQSVNVYGLPEKCYEVRTEDNAVDIQIHRKAQPYFPTTQE